MVNAMIRRQDPLFATVWAGRTGTDKAMPFPGLVEGDVGDWYKTVKVDLAICREYAEAVHTLSERFIGAADDARVNESVDMSPYMAILPFAAAFSIFVVGHVNNHAGEISAMKGVHGFKGYPF